MWACSGGVDGTAVVKSVAGTCIALEQVGGFGLVNG